MPRRLLAVFGAIVILAGLLISGAGRPADVFGAGGPANALDHFTVAAPSSATAGIAFTVTVTAYDRRDRVITDYVGPGTLSGLAASPNGATPAYGATTWLDGVGRSQVTAKKSQAGAIVWFTDTATLIGGSSGTISVLPSSATQISFSGQPVDTKFNNPITSSLATGAAVKVLALDAYGNRVDGVSVTIDDDDAGVALAGIKTVSTAGGTLGVAPFGEASFSTLSLPDLGTYALVAAAGLLGATSVDFEVVADLAKCDGSSCKNTGDYVSSTVPQRTYGTISPNRSLFANDVVLTTQFVAKGASRCANDDAIVFGQTTEVRVQDTTAGGPGVTATEPGFQVSLLYPYQTLQALNITSRGVPSFEVCLGATLIDPGYTGGPWQAKNLTTGVLENAQEDPDASGVFWGWVPDCAAVVSLLGNPCIELRTKSASQLQSQLGLTRAQFRSFGYKSGDLALVVRKPWPWDGKFTAR